MFGTPNRRRVLEKWANVVGQERALKELNYVLNAYDNLDAASEALGLSKYLIRELKKSFSKMPQEKELSLKSSTFGEFLREIASRDFKRGIEFQLIIVSPLIKYLGLSPGQLRLDYLVKSGSHFFRPDILIFDSTEQKPSILFEIKLIKGFKASKTMISGGRRQLEEFEKYIPVNKSVLFTNSQIHILENRSWVQFDLKDISDSDALKLLSRLKTKELPRVESGVMNSNSGGKVDELHSLLSKTRIAETNSEKKESMERLAERIFEYQYGIEVRRNIRTKSSEIDLICECLDDSPHYFIRDLGRYFFVECKNWATPVGAKEIRDFKGKMESAKVKLGIYFSKNGITGEKNGTDAKNEIEKSFSMSGFFILVISNNELEQLDGLRSFPSFLKGKIEGIRFNL